MSRGDLRGNFIWHELMAPDPRAAADFYSSVLPWTSEASGVPGYTLWMTGAIGVAGLMTQPEAARQCDTPPSWLVYIAAPDVDETTESAQRLGGKVLKSPTDIPGIGRFAVLSDPRGAAFAVFTPAMAPPAGAKPDLGRFSWHELATIDPQGALSFYAELFGWTRGPAHDMGAGNLYHIIEHGGARIGGVYTLRDPSKPPHWLSYVRIEHLDEAIAAATAHGGRLLSGPHPVPGGARVAHIMDPQGGTIALHEQPPAGVKQAPQAGTRVSRATRRKAPRKPAPRRAPARAKAPAKRAAKRSAKKASKPTAKRAAKRVTKPAAKRAAKRTAKPAAKRTAKRVTRPTARRTAKRAAARKPAAKRHSAHRSAAATGARAKKRAKRAPPRKTRR